MENLKNIIQAPLPDKIFLSTMNKVEIFKNLYIIVAIGKNYEIGANNDLVWECSEDLQYFKEITMGSSLLMGGNTFDSLPGILPGREHYVFPNRNQNRNQLSIAGVNTLDSVEEGLNLVRINPHIDYFVIGGGKFYGLLKPYVSTMYITEVDAYFPKSTVFFPEIDRAKWNIELGDQLIDPITKFKYRNNRYTRKF